MAQYSKAEVRQLADSIRIKVGIKESLSTILIGYNSGQPYSVHYVTEDKAGKKKRSKVLPEKNYDYYPWQDVLASMCKNCESVTAAECLCEKCGHGLIKFYFRSPLYTWKGMCGRACTITVCPYCPKQVSMGGIMIMN